MRRSESHKDATPRRKNEGNQSVSASERECEGALRAEGIKG